MINKYAFRYLVLALLLANIGFTSRLAFLTTGHDSDAWILVISAAGVVCLLILALSSFLYRDNKFEEAQA